MISKPMFFVALLCTGAAAGGIVRYQEACAEAAARGRRVAELEKQNAGLQAQLVAARRIIERPELARQLDRVDKLTDREREAVAAKNVKMDPALIESDVYIGWPVTLMGAIATEMDPIESAKVTDGGRIFVVQQHAAADPEQRVWYVGLRKAPPGLKANAYFAMFAGLHAGAITGPDGKRHPVLAAKWGMDMGQVAEDMERQKHIGVASK